MFITVELGSRTETAKEPKQPINQSQTRMGFVTFPYIQGVSERIARTLNQFNVNVAHKPVKTVGFILPGFQDLSTGVIYRINCKDGDKVYIGKTSRAFRTRTKEHKRAVSHVIITLY